MIHDPQNASNNPLINTPTSRIRPSPQLFFSPRSIAIEPSTSTIVESVAPANKDRTIPNSKNITTERPSCTRRHKRIRVNLKVVLVLSVCFFTACPTVLVWYYSLDLCKSSMGELRALSRDSIEELATQLRGHMVRNAENSFLQIVRLTEATFLSHLYQLSQGGLPSWEAGDTATSYYNRAVLPRTNIFFPMRANEYNSMTFVMLCSETSRFGQPLQTKLSGVLYVRFQMPGDVGPTIYAADTYWNDWLNDSSVSYYRINQTDASVTEVMYKVSGRAAEILTANISPESDATRPAIHEWRLALHFSVGSGFPQMQLFATLPVPGTRAFVLLSVFANVWTVSSFLKGILQGPNERLYLNFRTPEGVLVGASHGKVFSHSDIDYSHNNPVVNPPPVSEFRRFSPVNSTDQAIAESAQYILNNFGGWDMVPSLNAMISVLGQPYWIASATPKTELGLRTNLFLLIDRDSIMGSIEERDQTISASIDRMNRSLIIIMLLVVLLASAFAVFISYRLGRSLNRLVSAMNILATLDLNESHSRSVSIVSTTSSCSSSVGTLLLKPSSRFLEVYQCERSYAALERGTRAFMKYIPKTVVQLMLSGEMESTNTMTRERLTILFMDIAGFSTLCEQITAEELAHLTSEYLQSMCEIIVKSQGTLDKFIGDCIMAMWNAPQRLERHELYAVSASLDMQVALMSLCELWKKRGMAELRFRVGLNTDSVLVGNFGCEYRINYTCLGDGVNLASRLEAANKPLGTTVLVSSSTWEGVCDEFVFRRLGDITVPGKAQVLQVFEPLFSARPAEWYSVSRTQSSFGISEALPEDRKPILYHWSWEPKDAILSMVTLYEKGLDHILAEEYAQAQGCFTQALQFIPDDGASLLMEQQCQLAQLDMAHEANSPTMMQKAREGSIASYHQAQALPTSNSIVRNNTNFNNAETRSVRSTRSMSLHSPPMRPMSPVLQRKRGSRAWDGVLRFEQK